MDQELSRTVPIRAARVFAALEAKPQLTPTVEVDWHNAAFRLRDGLGRHPHPFQGAKDDRLAAVAA